MSDAAMGGRLDTAIVERLVDAAADEVAREDAAQAGAGQAPLDELQRELCAAPALSATITAVSRERMARGEHPLDGDEAMAYQCAAMAEIRHEGARLDELKADPGWTDLNVNGCDTAWLNYPDGRKVLVDPPLWRSDDEMRAWVQMRARLAGGGTEHRFDADAWMLTIDQDDGSRLSAVWGGRGQRGVASRPLLCIRRHQGALHAFTLDDLLALGSLSPAALEFLPAAVEARLNIVIAAMTGAGKTTLLRALALQTPRTERIITIERGRELRLAECGHLDVAELETRDPNTEARGEVGAAELVRATLRLSPSRLFLGEVLDKSDVSALLNAMSQGNEGSAFTVHARSTGDALGRLVSLCEQAEGLTTSTAGSVIAGALDLVVFISARAGPDGALRRRVRSIREVGAWDGHQVTGTDVFAPGPDGLGVPDRPFSSAAIVEALADAGYAHRLPA